ncbi:MAG: phage tail tape measure protein [Rhizobiaceae bacterium]|nr:phage tail tape measure protein [Rhizobiaceae bacterium]
MSDLDVALRLRLVNQLSGPAEQAERDLKELHQAAERLGRTRGGDQLGAEIRKIGAAATGAKADVASVGAEADQLRRALGRLNSTAGMSAVGVDAETAKRKIGEVGSAASELRRQLGRLNDTGGMSGLKGDADAAKRALETIGTGAREARQKIEWLDAAPLDKLKGEAASAEAAIKEIGQAADAAQGKLKGLGTGQPAPGTRPGDVVTPHPDARRRVGKVTGGVEGFVDRSGLDAYVPIGVGIGAGYLVGGGAGAAAMGVGRSYKRFAGDDRETEYILMNMGVSEADSDERRKQVRNIARDTKAPYAKVIAGLDTLAATGQPVNDVMDLLPPVMRTAMASGAEPSDVAKAAFTMSTKMGVAPKDIQQALDLMVAGGNAGMFEVPAMAAKLPDILTYASGAGFKGLEGLKKVIALMQGAAESTGGNTDAAATNLQNVFAKMRSEETERNFKEYGVNLPKAFKTGRAEGKDDIQILYDAAMKASKGGNPDILARLFTDMQAFLGLQSLIQQRGKIESTEAELAEAGGTSQRQYDRIRNDPQASLDSLANATDRASVALGGLADKLGMTREINNLAEGTENLLDDPARQLKLLLLGPSGTTMRDLWDKIFVGSAHAQERERDDSLSGYVATPGAGGIHAATGADAAEIQNLKQKLGAPMDAAAEQSMDGYNKALQAEGQEAVSIAQSIADSIRSMLGFTVSPTIQPRLVAPGGGGQAGGAGNGGAPRGVGGRQTASASPGVTVNNNIRTSNPQLAARRSQAEANRRVRLAQWNGIGDMGNAFG